MIHFEPKTIRLIRDLRFVLLVLAVIVSGCATINFGPSLGELKEVTLKKSGVL